MATIKKEAFKSAMNRFVNGELKICATVEGKIHSYYILNGSDDDSAFNYVERDVNMLAHIIVPVLLIADKVIPSIGESVRIPSYAVRIAENQSFNVVA